MAHVCAPAVSVLWQSGSVPESQTRLHKRFLCGGVNDQRARADPRDRDAPSYGTTWSRSYPIAKETSRVETVARSPATQF